MFTGNVPLPLHAARRLTGALLAAGTLMVPHAVWGGPSDLIATLADPTPREGDTFGAVTTGNDQIVVVADPREDGVATDAGAVYGFDLQTSAPLYTLTGTVEGGQLGQAMAVAGGRLAVTERVNGKGVVHIYDVNTGVKQQTISHPGLAGAANNFGADLDDAGNLLAVGAPDADGTGQQTGDVFLIDPATGGVVRTIDSPAGNTGFGGTLAATGNRVAVSYYEKVYLYNTDSGALVATLSNGLPGFGDRLAATEGYVAVRSKGEAVEFRSDVRRVTVYRASDGTQLYAKNYTAYSQSAETYAQQIAGFGNYFAVSSGLATPGVHTFHVFQASTGADAGNVRPGFLAALGNAGSRLLVTYVPETGSNGIYPQLVNVYAGFTGPSAPTGLTAETKYYARETGLPSFYLTWTDTSADESGFVIQRRLPGQQEFTTVTMVGRNVTEWTDVSANVEPSRSPLQVSYRVQAVSSIGSSAFSNVATATVPAIIFDLLATVDPLTSSVQLSWSDSTPAPGGYRVERRVATTSSDNPAGLFTEVAVLPAGTMTYTDAAVTRGASYSYRIRAIRQGVNFDFSNVADVSLTAQPADLLRTLANPDKQSGSGFGFSVAVIGSSVAVGAPWADGPDGVFDCGKVYVFDIATGALLHTLHGPQTATGDRFGWSLAVVRGNLLVGAPYREGRGAAYLFSGRSGQLLTTLSSPEPAAGELFGLSVAAVGDNLVLGAPGSGGGAGAAYLMNPRGVFYRKLTSPGVSGGGSAARAAFGLSVAGHAERVAVTAPGEDRVYFFNRGDGALLSSHQHAYSVAAASNGLFVVGNLTGNGPGAQSGYAYAINPETGQPTAALGNPSASPYDQFGFTVAAGGSVVAVGEPQEDLVFPDSGQIGVGSVRGFERFIQNPVPGTGDRFGASVSVAPDGQVIAVGAPNDDLEAVEAGSVSLFSN